MSEKDKEKKLMIRIFIKDAWDSKNKNLLWKEI